MLASLTAACQRNDAPQVESAQQAATAAPTPATFVGSAVCKDCHSQVYGRWSGSHHDLAMQVATTDTVLGDFGEVSATHVGVRTDFSVRDGKYFVRTEGPDGDHADFAVKFVFGVDPLQQYLVELPGGRLQALTWAWDSRTVAEGGQRWFSLNPDEPIPPGDVLHWTGPAYNWNLQCADCHSTGLRKGYNAGRDVYDTTYSEINVACEACHGPASLHVQLEQGVASGAAPEPAAARNRGLIVDLSEPEVAVWQINGLTGIARRSPALSTQAELETCAPCHSRRSLIARPQVGAKFLDTYRPSLLDPDLYFADGQILDEVYVYGSFLQSKMYRAGVRCSDCHDAHTLAVKDVAGAVCHQCHAAHLFDTEAHHHHDGTGAGTLCVDCHMPSRTYMGVDARRDHSFRVPRPDLSVTLDTPNACNGCHTDHDAQWSADRIDEWRVDEPAFDKHFAVAIQAGREGRADAAAELRTLSAKASLAPIVRATAMSLLEAYPDPATAQSIEAAARDDDALLRWAAARAAFGLPVSERAARVGRLLEDPVRLVRIEAARTLAAVPADALSVATRAALKTAIAEYRNAQLVEADRPGAHVNLANLSRMQGDTAAAERAYRQALKTGPYFIPAYINLADLYRELNRDGEAESVLRGGLSRAPDSAELYHAAGLTAVRTGEPEKALKDLGKAHALDGSSARYAYVYAVALHSVGDTRAALDTLKAALELHPSSADLLFASATMHRDAEQFDAALTYAERLHALLPGNASVRGLLKEIEARRKADEDVRH